MKLWFEFVFYNLLLGIIFISIAEGDPTLEENSIENKCPGLSSLTLDFKCSYKGNKTRCSDSAVHGTLAFPKCKEEHYFDGEFPYSVIYCKHGEWSVRQSHLISCIPICGRKPSSIKPLIVSGIVSKPNKFPWHVGLYIQPYINGTHTYICGGSIITHKLVISAAHCIDLRTNKPDMYYVAAGKHFRMWNHEKDMEIQRQVSDILIPDLYKGYMNGYSADIAILLISEAFDFSQTIRPVCIDYKAHTFNVTANLTGIVPGWGSIEERLLLSEKLRYVTIPLRDFMDCFRNVPSNFTNAITIDKICAGFKNGTSVCAGDSGGGLVQERKMGNVKTYYLIGLVSTAPAIEGKACDSSHYTTFTTIANHISWVKENINKSEKWSPYDHGCQLPNQIKYGNYTIQRDSRNNKIKVYGRLVPHYTELLYMCAEGYSLNTHENVICKDRQWNDGKSLPSCFKNCGALSSPYLNILCTFNDSTVPCNEPMIHATDAYFEPINLNFEVEYDKIECYDGQWQPKLPEPSPKCGVKYKEQSSILRSFLGVTEKNNKNNPWVIAIYSMDKYEYKFACSGILISTALIYRYGQFCKGLELGKYDINQYKLIAAAGIIHTDLNNTMNKQYQTSEILSVAGVKRHQFILLRNKFVITNSVRPICVLQETDYFNYDDASEVSFWSQISNILETIHLQGDTSASVFEVQDLADDTSYLIQRKNKHFGLRYYFTGLYNMKSKKAIIYYGYKWTILNEFLATNYRFMWLSDDQVTCTIPDIEKDNMVYELSRGIKTGYIVPDGTDIHFHCKSGFSQHGAKSRVCIEGKWINVGDSPFCYQCGRLDKYENNKRLLEEQNRLPWTVFLYLTNMNHQFYGTLVSSQIVLANDLFRNFNILNIRATTIWNSFNESDAHTIKAVIRSPFNITQKFNFRNIHVAMDALILNVPISITDNVFPVCIDSSGLIFDQMSELIPLWSAETQKLIVTNISSSRLKTNTELVLRNYSVPKECLKIGCFGSDVSVAMSTQNGDRRYFLHSIKIRSSLYVELYPFTGWINYIKLKYEMISENKTDKSISDSDQHDDEDIDDDLEDDDGADTNVTYNELPILQSHRNRYMA